MHPLILRAGNVLVSVGHLLSIDRSHSKLRHHQPVATLIRSDYFFLTVRDRDLLTSPVTASVFRTTSLSMILRGRSIFTVFVTILLPAASLVTFRSTSRDMIRSIVRGIVAQNRSELNISILQFSRRPRSAAPNFRGLKKVGVGTEECSRHIRHTPRSVE